MSDLSSLLDMQLDQLADLPEFKVYPPGAHKVTVELEAKKIGEHPAVELKMAYREVVELANPTDEVPAAGTECSVAFMLDNEFGQGNLKRVVTPLAKHFGVSKLDEVAEQLKGMEVTVVTKVRQNKEKTQTYCDIISITI